MAYHINAANMKKKGLDSKHFEHLDKNGPASARIFTESFRFPMNNANIQEIEGELASTKRSRYLRQSR